MVHDMRNLLSANTFDYVFNLFTSFGYFDHMHENLKTVKNMASSLKSGGRLILDFMNVNTIKPSSGLVETKHYDGFTFNIQRKVEADKVVKQIEVIKNSSSILKNLVNDILDYSKIQAGKMELEKISFSPIKTIAMSERTFRHQADQKNIFFRNVFHLFSFSQIQF